MALLEPFRGKVPDEVFTTEFKLPVTDGSGNNREGLKRALGLLRASIERPHERHAAERRYEVSSADFDCHLPHSLHKGHDIMPQSAGLDPQARQLSGVLLPRLC